MRLAFGAVLRNYRTIRGLTQEELADRSGLSVRAIRNLEIGRTERPQRQTAALLATALRLTDPDRATLLAAAGRRPTAPAPARPREVPARTPPAWPVRLGRCELPPDVPDLVGRAGTVAALRTVLTTPGPRLALVSGGPGVGRTATAVHVAHRVLHRFPDGQVYADLDHPDGQVPAEAVLGRVLRSLGVTDLPDSHDERTAMLRAGLAARRVLVLLDNVASEAQVRPLLTTGASSAVLVTSRRCLVALPGAHAVRLDPLATDAACHLLSRLAGDADPAAVQAVVEACARLPLALQVCGGWLLARPHRSLADLAALLSDEDLVLDRLAVADLSVRASIAAHVAGLRPDERRLLHQLSHLDDLPDPDDPTLRDGLDALTQANLLTDHRMNCLVRAYAREDADLPRLRAAR